MKKKRGIAYFLTGVLCLGLLMGCGQSTGGTGSGSQSAGSSQAGGTKQTVKIGYVNWSEGIAMTNLVAAVLEDKMGCDVELTMTDAAPLFASLASGGTDVFLDSWLPVTHASYMDKYGADLDDLGYNFKDAKIGLVVPSYMQIDSIEDLNGIKDQLDGKIVGIDAGAGIMSTTDTAISEYGLDYELMPGSGPTMTAALKKAIDAKTPIVVTGWTPHWMFARWDLKFLDDPKGVYGAGEFIHTITRKGFSDDCPEVAQFLKNFFMTDQQLGDLMGAIADSTEGQDPIDVARTWMNANQELVNSWIPAQ